MGKIYTPERMMSTALIKFMTAAFVGTSSLAMLVTLSPSGANGWETWFSLEYGKDMSSLKIPMKTAKKVTTTNSSSSKELKRLKKELKQVVESWKNTPTSGPAAKYVGVRLGNAIWIAQLGMELEQLGIKSESEEDYSCTKVYEELFAVDKQIFMATMNPMGNWKVENMK